MTDLTHKSEKPSKKLYVAGFAFSLDGSKLAFVRKNRPAWQAGRLNAIGGKVEEDETIEAAMRREFREEAGLDLAEECWELCVRLGNEAFEVAFFRTFTDRLDELASITDEEILIRPSLPVDADVLPNLHWLIGLCLDDLQFPVTIGDLDRGSTLRTVVEGWRSASEYRPRSRI